jgi:23S rRNA G2445 N2-methylase RlmL
MIEQKTSATFRFIYPPHLESIGMKEIAFFCAQIGNLEVNIQRTQPGTLSVKCPVEIGLSLIHLCKLPTRIRLSYCELGIIKDFPTLYKKMKKIPWPRLLYQIQPQIQLSAREAKLFDDRRVFETCHEAIKQSTRHQPLSAKALSLGTKLGQDQILFLRNHRDQWTLSLDLTGEAHFRHGLLEKRFPGSLRENLAAAMVKTAQTMTPTGQFPVLLDPFCGGGTIITEAITQFHWNDWRSFSYQAIPLFKSHLPNIQRTKKTYQAPINPWKDLIGTEIQSAPYQFLKEELTPKLKNVQTDALVEFYHLDAFDFKRHGPISIITNPPYGKQVLFKGQATSCEQLIDKLIDHFRPLSLHALSPARGLKKLHFKDYQKQLIDFPNNNIETALVRFTLKGPAQD